MGRARRGLLWAGRHHSISLAQDQRGACPRRRAHARDQGRSDPHPTLERQMTRMTERPQPANRLNSNSSRRRGGGGTLSLVLALLPAMGVALRAAADDAIPDQEDAQPQVESPAGETSAQAQQRVLKAMATDASVLINVTDREMPSS